MAHEKGGGAPESSSQAASRVTDAAEEQTSRTQNAQGSAMTSFASLGVDPPTVEEDPCEDVKAGKTGQHVDTTSKSSNPTLWNRMSGGWVRKA